MPENDHAAPVRAVYDAAAERYVEFAGTELSAGTEGAIDRSLLAAFVELVATRPRARVADVGCGPGRVAAFLARHGLDVLGVDVSTALLAQARVAHPGINFERAGSRTSQSGTLRLPVPSVGIRSSTRLRRVWRPCSPSFVVCSNRVDTCCWPSRRVVGTRCVEPTPLERVCRSRPTDTALPRSPGVWRQSVSTCVPPSSARPNSTTRRLDKGSSSLVACSSGGRVLGATEATGRPPRGAGA